MAHTNALVNIETIVDEYIHGYKKSSEDYFTYLLHACYCYRDFRLYDSDQVVTAKVSVSANKIIEMPVDMLQFVDLCISTGDGEFWSFTENRSIVNTTTFTGLTEGLDSDVGEGVGVATPRSTGYAVRGAVNDYNYMLDWEARRIFVDGIDSDTVVLFYVSSGADVTATTQVPSFIAPMIHSYLLWKESYWLPDLARERTLRERDYTNSKLTIRNLINSMSYNQWRDIILGSISQAPKR